MFKSIELAYFGLNDDDADENDLCNAYMLMAENLSEEDKESLSYLYEKLRQSFLTFRDTQRTNADLTLTSVTRKERRGDTHPPVAPKLAPPWNVSDILETRLKNIAEATSDIISYFTVKPHELRKSLRDLNLGAECTFNIHGTEQPDVYSMRYHGTSWLGFKDILKNGFLPSYGAGRYYQWQNYRADGPLVYTSPSRTCAARYPIALADDKNNACGAVVASDTNYLRVLLTCKVDRDKHQINIRNKKITNKMHFSQKAFKSLQ